MTRSLVITIILIFCTFMTPILAERSPYILQRHVYDDLTFCKSYVISEWDWINIRSLKAYDSILDFGFETDSLQAFNTTFKKYVIVKKFANMANCTALRGIGILPRTAGNICFHGTLSVHVKAFSFANLGTSYRNILKEYDIKINTCPAINKIIFIAKKVQLRNFHSLDTRVAVERGGYGKIVESSLKEARVYKGGILFLDRTYVETLTCEGICVGNVSVKTLYLYKVSKIENINEDSLKIRFKNGKSLTARYAQKIFIANTGDLDITIKGYSISLSTVFSNTSASFIARNVELKKVIAKNNSSITLDYPYTTEVKRDNSSKILKKISLTCHGVRRKHDSMWVQYGEGKSAPETLIKYWDSSIVVTQEYLSEIYKQNPMIILPLLVALTLTCLSCWRRDGNHED